MLRFFKFKAFVSSYILLLLFVFCFSDFALYAAEEEETEAEETSEEEVSDYPNNIKARFQPSLFVSARAAGMGGALSTLADGVHAPYYNPAGIGGLIDSKLEKESIRQLHFPYFGTSVNESMNGLVNELSKAQNTNSEEAKAALSKTAGQHHVGRFSGVVNFNYLRYMAIAYYDSQVVALKKDPDTDEAETPVAMNRMDMTGLGLGGSYRNQQKNLFVGAYLAFHSYSILKKGFMYESYSDAQARNKFAAENTYGYTGFNINIGISHIFYKKYNPIVSLVVRNVGKSKYKATTIPQGGSSDSIHGVEQNVVLGVSASPEVHKDSYLNTIAEYQYIGNKVFAGRQKFRVAVEYTYGGFGSEASAGLRFGYNNAGISYGFNINLGLIQLEVSSAAINLGDAGEDLKERQDTMVLSVNILDN